MVASTKIPAQIFELLGFTGESENALACSFVGYTNYFGTSYYETISNKKLSALRGGGCPGLFFAARLRHRGGGFKHAHDSMRVFRQRRSLQRLQPRSPKPYTTHYSSFPRGSMYPIFRYLGFGS